MFTVIVPFAVALSLRFVRSPSFSVRFLLIRLAARCVWLGRHLFGCSRLCGSVVVLFCGAWALVKNSYSGLGPIYHNIDLRGTQEQNKMTCVEWSHVSLSRAAALRGRLYRLGGHCGDPRVARSFHCVKL